jgi:spore germination cell wall hydrolase CwlJ-like protein
MCLAINIFHEARSEPIMGQYGVALVTLNRAQTPERICHETFKSKQFSWTTGVTRAPTGWRLPRHMLPNLANPVENTAWAKAKIIATVTLQGRMSDFTGGAQFYHATYVSPGWAPRLHRVRKIGQHIFYKHPTK